MNKLQKQNKQGVLLHYKKQDQAGPVLGSLDLAGVVAVTHPEGKNGQADATRLNVETHEGGWVICAVVCGRYPKRVDRPIKPNNTYISKHKYTTFRPSPPINPLHTHIHQPPTNPPSKRHNPGTMKLRCRSEDLAAEWRAALLAWRAYARAYKQVCM